MRKRFKNEDKNPNNGKNKDSKRIHLYHDQKIGKSMVVETGKK